MKVLPHLPEDLNTLFQKEKMPQHLRQNTRDLKMMQGGGRSHARIENNHFKKLPNSRDNITTHNSGIIPPNNAHSGKNIPFFNRATVLE